MNMGGAPSPSKRPPPAARPLPQKQSTKKAPGKKKPLPMPSPPRKPVPQLKSSAPASSPPADTTSPRNLADSGFGLLGLQLPDDVELSSDDTTDNPYAVFGSAIDQNIASLQEMDDYDDDDNDNNDDLVY